jgi:hypothetical protein
MTPMNKRISFKRAGQLTGMLIIWVQVKIVLLLTSLASRWDRHRKSKPTRLRLALRLAIVAAVLFIPGFAIVKAIVLAWETWHMFRALGL